MFDCDFAPNRDRRRFARMRGHVQARIQPAVLCDAESPCLFPTLGASVDEFAEITAQTVQSLARPFRLRDGEFNVLVECDIPFAYARKTPRKRKLIALGQNDSQIPDKVERLDAFLPRLPRGKDSCERRRPGTGMTLLSLLCCERGTQADHQQNRGGKR